MKMFDIKTEYMKFMNDVNEMFDKEDQINREKMLNFISIFSDFCKMIKLTRNTAPHADPKVEHRFDKDNNIAVLHFSDVGYWLGDKITEEYIINALDVTDRINMWWEDDDKNPKHNKVHTELIVENVWDK